MTKPILVQPAELRTMLSDPTVVLIDCAHHAAEYSRAHIAGAILRPKHAYVKGIADDGLFLPQPDEIAELAEAMGIGAGSTVVCYDNGGGKFAARLWWVLKYYGHADVQLLDGGWRGWLAEGGAISCKASKPAGERKPFEPTANRSRVATLEDLQNNHNSWAVLDTRSDVEFSGTEARNNKRTGHIPNAKHVEWLAFLDETDGVQKFKSPDEIKKLVAAKHGHPCVTY